MTYILSLGAPHPQFGEDHGIDGAVADHDDMAWHIYLFIPQPTAAELSAIERGNLNIAIHYVHPHGWIWLLVADTRLQFDAPFAPALQEIATRSAPARSPEGSGRLLIHVIDDAGILRAMRLVGLPVTFYDIVERLYRETATRSWRFSEQSWGAGLQRFWSTYKTVRDAVPGAVATFQVPNPSVD